MHFKENRRLAAFVLVAVIALSILLTGAGGLGRLRARAEAQFYAEMGIQYDLNARIEAAYNLGSLCARYSRIDKALIDAVTAAREALSTARGIADKHQKNTALSHAVEDLFNEVADAGMSEADLQFAKKQYAELQSRAATIGYNAYNQQADAFNRTLGALPARLIGALSGIKPLEAFR